MLTAEAFPLKANLLQRSGCSLLPGVNAWESAVFRRGGPEALCGREHTSPPQLQAGSCSQTTVPGDGRRGGSSRGAHTLRGCWGKQLRI